MPPLQPRAPTLVPVHDYEKNLKRSKRAIQKLPNADVALRFLDHMSALGLSAGRVSKYAAKLAVLLRRIDKDLKELSRDDVEQVVAWINSQPHKEWTKHDSKLVLRKIVQYAKQGSCSKGTPLPAEVSWISLVVKEKDFRATPENLLTQDEVAAIVKAATNTRDRALVYVLFEAALRPGELLTMIVGGVEFREEYCLISVNGKTGIKRIPLVVSFKPLLEWLRDHPCKDDRNAPLWCSLSSNHVGERLSYQHFRLRIKRLAEKAGVKKDIWPYLYRHSTLTAMAKVFTEAKLEQFAGWTYGSKMTRRYVHFSARDLEDAVLELHGLKQPQRDEGLARLIECPRCRGKNPFGSVRCSFCGYILDRCLAEEVAQKSAERELEVQTRLQRLEQTITALLNGAK
jgi:site-specific recombinase XerD